VLSEPFRLAIEAVLQKQFGSQAGITQTEPVFGGDIHQARKLFLKTGDRVFLKFNHTPLPNVFELEARGLALIRGTRTLPVPEVLGFDNGTENYPAFLLLGWVASGATDRADMHKFGEGLAKLHRQTQPQHGLDHDNYIGPLAQPNTPCGRWVEFYRDQRLQAQVDLARERNKLTPQRARLLETLLDRLEHLIDEGQCAPSLLHGDLWRGNVIASANDVWVIDPAAYYGHREIEIAFTELFGGFPEEFYQGYQSHFPLPTGYEDRKALYQLYPLLVHLNLFGQRYAPAVDRVLSRYVG